MNTSLKYMFLASCIMVPISAQAQIGDGDFQGTMQCGPLLTNPASSAWTQPIRITSSGNTLTWLRADSRFSEIGKGQLQASRVSLTLDGTWNPGEKNIGNWRTVAMLNLEGNKLSGLATIYSDKDNRRLRECTVSVDVNASPVEGAKVTTTIMPLPSLKVAGKALSQATDRLAGQAANAVNQTTAVVIGAVGTVTEGGQSGTATLAVASSNEGNLFKSKAELLQKTRSGQFLNLHRFADDEKMAFSTSVLSLLINEYKIVNWPIEKTMVNGIPVSRISGACKGEFEAYVKNLFFQTANAHSNTLSDLPPAFTNSNQNIQSELRSINQTSAQLSSLKTGWCSKAGIHPYQNILPAILTEFDAATALAIEDRRNLLRIASEQKQQQSKMTREAANLAATTSQQITADMCLDGVCVEQDLGTIDINLNWIAPISNLDRLPSNLRKQAESEMLKKVDACEEANKSQWGSTARKLCERLTYTNFRSPAEIISFFKEHKAAVCETGYKFQMGVATTTGITRFSVAFGKDGRPKVVQIVKWFEVSNKFDVEELEKKINEKHPYLKTKAPLWGGSVRFVSIPHSRYHNGHFHYELNARNGIFPRSRDELEGVCAQMRKSISVR